MGNGELLIAPPFPVEQASCLFPVPYYSLFPIKDFHQIEYENCRIYTNIVLNRGGEYAG